VSIFFFSASNVPDKPWGQVSLPASGY